MPKYLTREENYQAALKEARLLSIEELAEEVKWYRRHALACHSWAVEAYEDAWEERKNVCPDCGGDCDAILEDLKRSLAE